MKAEYIAPFPPPTNVILEFPEHDAFPGMLKHRDAIDYHQGIVEDLYIPFEHYDKVDTIRRSLHQEESESLVELENFDTVEQATLHGLEMLADVIPYGANEGFMIASPSTPFEMDFTIGDDSPLVKVRAKEEQPEEQPELELSFAVGDPTAISNDNENGYVVVGSWHEAYAIEQSMPNVVTFPSDKEANSSATQAILKLSYLEACEAHGISPNEKMTQVWPAIKQEMFAAFDAVGMNESDFLQYLAMNTKHMNPSESFTDIIPSMQQVSWVYKDMTDAIDQIRGYLSIKDKAVMENAAIQYMKTYAQTVQNSDVVQNMPDFALWNVISKEKGMTTITGEEKEMDIYTYANSQPFGGGNLFALVDDHGDGTSTVYTPPQAESGISLSADSIKPKEAPTQRNDLKVEPKGPQRK